MPQEVTTIRNIAVVANGGAGKTSLVEAMLYDGGSTDRMGSVLDGNTVTDFDPEEINRKITVSSAIGFLNWSNHRINVIDTPGFINFLEDSKGSLRVADGAVLVVNALTGVRSETVKLWAFSEELGVPRLVFLNSMDRENANFESALKNIESVFKKKAIPISMPIGSGDKLEGVVDILKMKAYRTNGQKQMESDIPADLADQAEEYRKELLEVIAENDDSLLEKYLETGEITQEEMIAGLKGALLRQCFIPVVGGSAIKNIGVHQLLNAIIVCLPSPVEFASHVPIKAKSLKDGADIKRVPSEKEPLSAYVFKTVADPFAGKLTLFRVYSGVLKADSNVLNSSTGAKERIGQVFYMLGKKQIPAQSVGPGEIAVVAKLKETGTGDTLTEDSSAVVLDRMKFMEPIISYAIEPKSKGDEEKVSVGIHRILDEDPTIRFSRDEETKEMLLSGMGQMHLEVTLEKMKRKFNVEVTMKSPKIPYKETIKGTARAQGKYKKQSGGKGQYGDCWIDVSPLHRGQGFEFIDNVVGGAIPRSYIPAVEKGIVEAMKEGIVAGYPMMDVRVSLFDGSYHDVDSSEMAFKIAGSFAIKKAVMDAKPIILEPLMKVEVNVPDEYLGTIIGDLNAKRGKVQGMDQAVGGGQKIVAVVPMAEMLTYANNLHALTSGQGMYHMEFSHYEELPTLQAQKLIAEKQKKSEEK